jgi:hypothetical protein
MTIADVFDDLGWWLTVVTITGATLLGLARFRQLPASLRYLTLFAGFEATIELTSKLLIRVFHLKSNLFLIPLDAIGSVGLLALAYGHALQSAAFTKAMPWVLGVFGSYVLFDTLTKLGLVGFAPSVQVITDLLFFSFAGLYFQKMLNELQVTHLRREPFFWMSAGTVVYALGDLQLALFSNYILLHIPLQQQLTTISFVRVFLLFTFYSGCFLALWMRPQR